MAKAITDVPVPRRMQTLGVDPRGYPIPWNVMRGLDGAGLFTVNDDRKHLRAIAQGLCPICGERLGQWKWFVGGPLSAFDPHGWYLDLPGHRDCMEYTLQVCPYLALPKYLGRIDIPKNKMDNVPPEARLFVDHTMLPDRPEIFVAQASSEVEVKPNTAALPYVRPRKPVLAYQYWRHGHRLSEAEALPFLRAALGEWWMPPTL